MHRSSHPDGGDSTMRAIRSPSISSDVMSTSTRSITSTVPFALPAPAYVAQTEASKLISSEIDRNVSLSNSALALLNDFLDHVLFTILSTSRSLSLGALRSAVPSVLKPRLGKAAVRVAEEELKEYLDEEDDADSSPTKGMINLRRDFDVELAWKLARLRCMVYTRLGDLEEEDEEEWLEKEQLLEQAERLKQGDIVVSPPSAIFLTSVIEYLGEQSLYYAAQHAQRRHNLDQITQHDGIATRSQTLTPKTDDIVLEGKDMNHVGRDSPLSRLWRSWRRNTRETGSRAMSPDHGMLDSPIHSRTGSYGRPFPPFAYQGKAVAAEVNSPRHIPLPINDRDIDEIEIPGLASAQSDSEDDTPELPDRSHKRPVSLISMPGAFPGSYSLLREQPDQESELYDVPADRPVFTRKRSSSTPMPFKRRFSVGQPDQNDITKPIAEDDVEHPATEPETIQSVSDDTAIEGTQQLTSSDVQDIQQSNTTASQSSTVASRRERVPSQDQGTINKRAGMVGGAMAAAVGALGAGAAVAAASNRRESNSSAKDDMAKSHQMPLATTQKRTVAEEMLGTGSAVPPPKDATTGASITNVADFDRMYVPVQMVSEVTPIAELDADPMSSAGAVTSSVFSNPIYSQDEGIRSATNAQHASDDEPIQERLLDPNDLFGAAPSSALVHEQYKDPVRQVYRQDATNDGYKTTTLLAGSSTVDRDSPVSPLPKVLFNRDTPDTNVSSSSEDTIAARPGPLASNPTKHNHTDSKSSMQSHHSKSSSSSSRLLGFTRDAQGRPQTISQQRASGGMTEDARAAHSSTPTSFNNRDGRPETANSSTGKMFGKHHKQAESIDDIKKKSLEVLIRSNETLHYTLTPTTVMKEDESFITAKNRTETQDMADFIRNTGPTDQGSGRAQKLDALPPVPTTHDIVTTGTPKTVPSTQKSDIPSLQGIQQSVSSPDRPRNTIGQPRDARPEHSSGIRDLADYARSTGPMTESQLPRALSPRPPVTNKTSLIPRSPAQPVSTTTKSTNRLKFQARDPRPSGRAETSDLIDFIREGPPRVAGDHRIDRKVAPFRTTMDSEDFNNLASSGDRGVNFKHPERNTHQERAGGPSINSQTALLANNRTTNNAVNGTSMTSSKQLASTDDGRPPRTRTKKRDPYAIDYSDDDDDDDEEDVTRGNAGLSKPQRNEESLIDFLRNTAPPPGMETQPILSIRPGNTVPMSVGDRTPGIKTNGAREASPHLTQTGSKIDKYKPTQPTHAPHVDKSRSKPKFEAREPITTRTGTSDLADYLRNSGPPPSLDTRPQPLSMSNINKPVSAEKEGGLFKMFSKKKTK